MAYEQVDVFVEDSSAAKAPLAGVLVRIYNVEGSSVFGEAVTDDLGRAGFLLSDQEYSMRFYRYQVGFTQPQRFTVESNPDTPGTTPNAFTVTANTLTRPVASDPRLCRCSGYFRDATGAPRANLDIHFIAAFVPALVDGSLVMDERRVIKTDKNGFGCIDLLRCACYTVTIENWEGELRPIRVPNASGANLPDVLFPVVAGIVVPAISLTVGQSQDVVPVVYDSAGVPLQGTGQGDVRWSVADPAIASVTVQSSKLVVHGIALGATTLVATRVDMSVVRIPDVGITGSPAPIVVG